ncbi:MAG: hypothetical protein QM769_11225 [Pseudoxanthomonas sp.]
MDQSTVDAQGIYKTPVLDEQTPASANVLGIALQEQLVFTGNVADAKFEGGPSTKVKFWCGTVSGMVTSPLAQALTGKFTAIRIDNPDHLPKPAINCDGDIATFAVGQ